MNIFVLFFRVLNKKVFIFIYIHILNKTNKCQINAKKGGKIFLEFFMFEQKIISQKQKEKCKIINISHNGPGGCKWKKGLQKVSCLRPSPSQLCLQPPATFEQQKTRVSLLHSNS